MINRKERKGRKDLKLCFTLSASFAVQKMDNYDSAARQGMNPPATITKPPLAA
jgi:hypothetical protein